jgi:5-formyltetrahydrofolate cyclo-ligase
MVEEGISPFSEGVNIFEQTADAWPTIWARIESDLLRHAIPDSRFHHDYSQFVPDFRGSWAAINRVLELPCYKTAKTIFVAPDNSLQQLRYRALIDGKKLLVATHGLRRGFVLLDPARIPEERYELASCLDGMERPSIGRNVSLVQLQEEWVTVDMFIIGSLAVSVRGVQACKNREVSSLQWHILSDMGVLTQKTPVLTVVHECQVLDQKDERTNSWGSEWLDHVQCDLVVTPDRVIQIDAATKPEPNQPWLDKVPPELTQSMSPLQELMGIAMMDKIMRKASSTKEGKKPEPRKPQPEEQMGIDIVTKLMKGYKV